MKPFNLEQFKKGKLAVSASGYKFKYITTIPEAVLKCQIVALNLESNLVYTVTPDGRIDPTDPNPYFFMEETEVKKELWILWVKAPNGSFYYKNTYYTEQTALNAKTLHLQINTDHIAEIRKIEEVFLE